MTEEDKVAIKKQVATWQNANKGFILTQPVKGVYGWGFNLLQNKTYFRVTPSVVERLGGYKDYEDNHEVKEGKQVTKHNFNNMEPKFMYEFNVKGSAAEAFSPDVQNNDIDKYLYVRESSRNAGGSRKRRRNNKTKMKYFSKGGSKKRQSKKSYKNR
jgi:hypothetical protein